MAVYTIPHTPFSIVLIGILLLAFAGFSDFRSLRIPNWLCIAVAALGVVRLLMISNQTIALYMIGPAAAIFANPMIAVYTIGAAVAVFVITFILFFFRIMGGGDAKLLSATVLLIGNHDLLLFLILMGIISGLISLMLLFVHHYLPLYLGPRFATQSKVAVPYGIAIAGAGIMILAHLY